MGGPATVVCGLDVEDLCIPSDAPFDPMQPPLKAQLLQKLRLSPGAQVEPMRGGIGSCNAGMWLVKDGRVCLVLKLVRSSGLLSQTSEVEKFAKLNREWPGIGQDPSLAFPFKLFRCQQPGGGNSWDLVVMRQVPGQRMSELIMKTLHGRAVQELMRILEQFGGFLADFHARYGGMQHGDLTPANVFYDPIGGRFTLVDVSDLAPRNPVIQADTERFSSSLRLLSTFYGPQLFMEGKAHFEAGYSRRR